MSGWSAHTVTASWTRTLTKRCLTVTLIATAPRITSRAQDAEMYSRCAYISRTSTRRGRRSEMTERIHEAAIRQHGIVYCQPRPLWHCNVIWGMLLQGIKLDHKSHISGFTTTWGRFVDRKEAWDIAVREGQLLPEFRCHHTPGMLYSENVWAGGKKESTEQLRQLQEAIPCMKTKQSR